MLKPSPIVSSKLLVLLRGAAILVIGLVMSCQISAVGAPQGPSDDGPNGEVIRVDNP